MYSLLCCQQPLPECYIYYNWWTSIGNLPKSILYIMAHSWYCIFYGYGQIYDSMYPSLECHMEYFYCPKLYVFYTYSFNRLRFPSTSYLIKRFVNNRFGIFFKCLFCIYWHSCMVFLFQSVNVVNYSDCFWILEKTVCIPGVDLTWSWYTILLIYLWMWFAEILFIIFVSLFVRNIGL